jgi:hypothetical protein
MGKMSLKQNKIQQLFISNIMSLILLKKIVFKFDNQAFIESNYDFLYDELERFNALAISYITKNIYTSSGMHTLHILQGSVVKLCLVFFGLIN